MTIAANRTERLEKLHQQTGQDSFLGQQGVNDLFMIFLDFMGQDLNTGWSFPDEKRIRQALHSCHRGELEINSRRLREEFRRHFGYALPDRTVLELVRQSGRPVVGLGSGSGYLEAGLLQAGIAARATDPQRGYGHMRIHWDKRALMEIETLDAVGAVEKYAAESPLFLLSWPSYELEWGADAARALPSGSKLLYIGEPCGGCTGSDLLFRLLETDFTKTETIMIPHWPSLHDQAWYLTKK